MYQTSTVHRPNRLWFFRYPSTLWRKQSDSPLQPGGVEQWNGLQNTALTPNTALQLHQLLIPMFKAICSLKQTVRYEKKARRKKKGKKAHLTVVYHTCLHGHLLWLGPEVKHNGKYLFSASAIKWVSIYPLLHNLGYGMPSKPPETQDTSQNLEQNQNLKF